MVEERIEVRVTATGQVLEVIVFSKRLDCVTVVLGEGVHSVRVDLMPTRNGMAYARKGIGAGNRLRTRPRGCQGRPRTGGGVPRLQAVRSGWRARPERDRPNHRRMSA